MRGDRLGEQVLDVVVEDSRGAVPARVMGVACGGDRGQRHRLADTGELFHPVLAVGAEPAGLAVAGFVGVEVDQRGGTGDRRFALFADGGVDLGRARERVHRTVTVDNDVMSAFVPEPVLVTDSQYDIGGERFALHVDRRAGVLVHPAQRGRPRVGLTAQIHPGPARPPRHVHPLVRHPVDLE
ncbi:hypothetical protein GCM10011610_01940 [Nocardia rhizosphaerihabitans]|uniref:Uncharacterized protein n=1 Tax=Nocardia rhizosphaerihabitans TaxID=1691570 RepID=A0ABQ2K425_9NOCA|nr:hypothetical protein GCM10011610_01940 [Nocardia rhizosphaerihabitans]